MGGEDWEMTRYKDDACVINFMFSLMKGERKGRRGEERLLWVI